MSVSQLPVFKLLVWREIREAYVASSGGLLWALLVPLAQLAIYAFVFTKILQIRLPGTDATAFVPFLAIAFWPWTAFSDGLLRATTSLSDNRQLIGKVQVPFHVLVLAKMTAPFLLALGGYVAVIIVLASTGTSVHLSALPGAIWLLLLLYAFTAALSLIASVTQVFLPDLRHALHPILMLGFFATPILYSPSMVPEKYRGWFDLNPLAYLVERLRSLLLQGHWQPTLLDLFATLVFGGFLLLAIIYFNRLAPRVEEYL